MGVDKHWEAHVHPRTLRILRLWFLARVRGAELLAGQSDHCLEKEGTWHNSLVLLKCL